jgi:fructose transport system substrate-binding protein
MSRCWRVRGSDSFGSCVRLRRSGIGQDIVGLITKTNTNPFFVKMKQGAEEKAQELGMELRSFAGEYDGDNEAQVAAIENLIAAGAKGILITPSDRQSCPR